MATPARSPEFIDVKDAVQAARGFVSDLFSTGTVVRLEEVEFVDSKGEWLVTLSLSTPSAFVLGTGAAGADFKVFRVDGRTGKVKSMRNAE